MSDREEREEHIKRLEAALACEEKQFSGKCSKQTCDDNCSLLYDQGNWGEWKETLRYAINSLKTDLKYDLLYEETIEQSDKQADKPTTKNDLGVDYRSLKDIKKLVERKADDLDGVMLDAGGVIIGLYFAIANDLPSVTPQELKIGNWDKDGACPFCGYLQQWDDDSYCGHCGAKLTKINQDINQDEVKQ